MIIKVPFSYYGGKTRLAPTLANYIPSNIEIYCEPFFGGGSLFFYTSTRWAPVEIINDINDDVVNFFRTLREPRTAKKLIEYLKLTPHARSEYMRAWEIINKTRQFKNDIERAALFYIVKQQSFSNVSAYGSWSLPGNTKIKASEWEMDVNRLERDLNRFIVRLKHASFESRPAQKIIKLYDKPETFFYLDPPYILSRTPRLEYHGYDLTDQQHEELIELCLSAHGMIMLSGYNHPIYDPLEKDGWEKLEIEIKMNINNNKKEIAKRNGKQATRCECVWLNPQLQKKTETSKIVLKQARLF